MSDKPSFFSKLKRRSVCELAVALLKFVDTAK